jgi:YgiT-type zinc finger domain-containing protein
MICLICRQATVADGPISVKFERGEMRLVVNNIPAQICPSCGEAYLAEEVAQQLLNEAEKISKEGLLNIVHEY